MPIGRTNFDDVSVRGILRIGQDLYVSVERRKSGFSESTLVSYNSLTESQKKYVAARWLGNIFFEIKSLRKSTDQERDKLKDIKEKQDHLISQSNKCDDEINALVNKVNNFSTHVESARQKLLEETGDNSNNVNTSNRRGFYDNLLAFVNKIKHFLSSLRSSF